MTSRSEVALKRVQPPQRDERTGNNFNRHASSTSCKRLSYSSRMSPRHFSRRSFLCGRSDQHEHHRPSCHDPGSMNCGHFAQPPPCNHHGKVSNPMPWFTCVECVAMHSRSHFAEVASSALHACQTCRMSQPENHKINRVQCHVQKQVRITKQRRC